MSGEVRFSGIKWRYSLSLPPALLRSAVLCLLRVSLCLGGGEKAKFLNTGLLKAL